jgi:hypothetical protein
MPHEGARRRGLGPYNEHGVAARASGCQSSGPSTPECRSAQPAAGSPVSGLRDQSAAHGTKQSATRVTIPETGPVAAADDLDERCYLRVGAVLSGRLALLVDPRGLLWAKRRGLLW